MGGGDSYVRLCYILVFKFNLKLKMLMLKLNFWFEYNQFSL